jgi:Fe-S-cluster containining protein
MPESLREELRAYYHAVYVEKSIPNRVRLELPCLWYDEETKRCRHYEHRPEYCREFEVGGEDCLAWREPAGQGGCTAAAGAGIPG